MMAKVAKRKTVHYSRSVMKMLRRRQELYVSSCRLEQKIETIPRTMPPDNEMNVAEGPCDNRNKRTVPETRTSAQTNGENWKDLRTKVVKSGQHGHLTETHEKINGRPLLIMVEKTCDKSNDAIVPRTPLRHPTHRIAAANSRATRRQVISYRVQRWKNVYETQRFLDRRETTVEWRWRFVSYANYDGFSDVELWTQPHSTT